MADKKHRLDWQRDMNYAVVTGTPTGWEVRFYPRRVAGRIVFQFTALFEGHKFASHDLDTDCAGWLEEYEDVLNEHPEAIEAVIDAAILKVQEFLNAAKQVLGMTAQ